MVALATIPYTILYLAIPVFCAIGVYSLNNRMFDIALAGAVGVFGYVLLKTRCEPAPLVLGPVLEENLRLALLISGGRWSIFVDRLAFLVLTGLLLALTAPPKVRMNKTVFEELAE